MSRPRTHDATSSTPLGDKLRLLAVGFQQGGNLERGRGLVQAADIVDGELAGFTGKALVEAIDRMLEQRLEGFVADVAAAVRDLEPSPRTSANASPDAGARRASKRKANGPPPLPIVEIEAPELAHYLPPRRPDEPHRTLGVGERQVLIAIAQHSPEGVDSEHLSLLTGKKKTTRDEYVGRLVRRGLVVRNAERRAVVTDRGLSELGSYEKLPTGNRLRAHYLATLPRGEREILAIVCKFFPHVVQRERIGELAGFKKTTRDEYIGRLKRRRLVEVHPGGTVGGSPRLFDAEARESA